MCPGLSVETPSYAAPKISCGVVRLASAGMHPSHAHDPNATKIFDLRRISFAISSFSLLRIAPLNSVSKIEPSAMASTSLYFASIATGQNTMSKFASTSRIFSWMFRTAISQPPQEAAQYIANLGLLVVMPASPLLDHGQHRHFRQVPMSKLAHRQWS